MSKIDDQIAVGTKVFTRTDDLRRLLASIPPFVSKVYVSDDGEMSDQKSSVYNTNYNFDLEVINLEYDAGLAAGRNAIVEVATEKYIFIVDTDHQLPPTAKLLYKQLKASPDIGGIGATLVEPENDRLYSQVADFREKQTEDGVKLIRESGGIDNSKTIRIVQDAPLIEFDFIPNAALFKRECLEDQSWDNEYIIEYEHTDFYLSHWKYTDWKFAISPSVQVLHYPGGDTDYMINRHSPKKSSHTEEYFFNKWEYSEMETTDTRWIEAGSIGTVSEKFESVVTILREEGPRALIKQIRLYLSSNR